MPEREPDELLDALELRAMEQAEEEDAVEAPDLLEAAVTGELAEAVEASAAKDITLRGYVEVHNRAAAFEGSDGQPYTVDVDVEETSDPAHPFVGFLVFLRWAETGAGIMGHLESGDIAEGATEEEARRAVMELSLYEVKAELDAAIQRRATDIEE